jgi:hypothetical protein
MMAPSPSKTDFQWLASEATAHFNFMIFKAKRHYFGKPYLFEFRYKTDLPIANSFSE